MNPSPSAGYNTFSSIIRNVDILMAQKTDVFPPGPSNFLFLRKYAKIQTPSIFRHSACSFTNTNHMLTLKELASQTGLSENVIRKFLRLLRAFLGPYIKKGQSNKLLFERRSA